MNYICYGIIAAAGIGERFGSRKQFEIVKDNHIVLDYSISAIKEFVKHIIIVVRDEDIDFVKNRYKYVSVVKGGSRRMDSVYNGLKFCKNCDFVLIHDAARPIIEKIIVKNVLSSAYEFGASIVGMPVFDTLKKVKNGFCRETIDRKNFYLAQTPQVFRCGDLISIYDKAYSNKKNYTDEASIWEDFIGGVHIIIGSKKNIKITTKEDLGIVRCLLE